MIVECDSSMLVKVKDEFNDICNYIMLALEKIKLFGNILLFCTFSDETQDVPKNQLPCRYCFSTSD